MGDARRTNNCWTASTAGKDDMPAFYYYLNDEEQREILAYIKEMFRP